MSEGKDLQAFSKNTNLILYGILIILPVILRFEHIIFKYQLRVRKKVAIENLLFPNDVISQEIKTELKLFCRSHV